MTLHDQLVELSGPHIEAYRNDLLVHDKDAIDRYPGVPFLHWTRKMGTHIQFLYPSRLLPANGETVPYLFGTANRKHIVEETLSMAEYFIRPTSDKTVLVLYYDGATLKQINLLDAFNIAYSYKVTILQEWNDDVQLAASLDDHTVRIACTNASLNS
jgi:hypothetical protein